MLLAVLVAGAVGWEQWRRVSDFRIDDAYITFSFSKNLAAGHGPVYSHGLRVEGYSNFLWMLLMSIPFAFGASDGYPFAQVLALGSLAVLVATTYRLARRHCGPIFAAGAAATVLSATDIFRAAASGLETVPYTSSLLAATAFYLGESPWRRRYSLFGFVIVALFRIDGMVPLAFVILFELVSAAADHRLTLKSWIRWAGPPLLLYACYFAWRSLYYGMPLPATYYAKEFANADPLRGIEYGWTAVRDFGLLAVLPFIAAGALLRPARDSLFLAALAVCHVVYVVHVGGDWMPFQRFWIPILPFGAILATWGAQNVWSAARRGVGIARATVAVVVAGAAGFVWMHAHAGTIDTPSEAIRIAYAAEVARHTRGELLGDVPFVRAIIREPADRLVTDYAGVFGLFVDAYVIDMWGLCNADIARKGNTNGVSSIYGKTCVECYRDLKPDYFHVTTPLVRGKDAFQSQTEVIAQVFQGEAIDAVIDLKRSYVAGRAIESTTGRTLWFLERRRAGVDLVPRRPVPGMQIDYPFEPASSHAAAPVPPSPSSPS